MFNYTEGEINAGFGYYVAYRAEKNSNTTEVDVPFCNGGLSAPFSTYPEYPDGSGRSEC